MASPTVSERAQHAAAHQDGFHQERGLHHGARHSGEDDDGEVLDEEGNADGADERGDARRAAQRTVGDAVHQKPAGRRARNGEGDVHDP